MVLFPGCPCCQTCGWPGGSNPDSIEVVLEDTAARTYYTNGSNGSQYVYIPSLNGTFSLAPYADTGLDWNWYGSYYIYEGASNGARFQVGVTWNYGQPNFVSVDDNSLVIAAQLWRTDPYARPATRFFHNVGGLTYLKRCNKSTLSTLNYKWAYSDNYYTFPSISDIVSGNIFQQNSSVSFESGEGCYLPGNVSTDVLYRTDNYDYGRNMFHGLTSNTFPISRTVTDPGTGTSYPYIGFSFSVRVVSVRCIYGTTSFPLFGNLGQTTCPTFT